MRIPDACARFDAEFGRAIGTAVSMIWHQLARKRWSTRLGYHARSTDDAPVLPTAHKAAGMDWRNGSVPVSQSPEGNAVALADVYRSSVNDELVRVLYEDPTRGEFALIRLGASAQPFRARCSRVPLGRRLRKTRLDRRPSL